MLTSPRCAAALSILVLAAGLGGAASAAEPEPPTGTVPAAKRQSAAPPPEAVAAGRAKPFHHQEAFIRLAIDEIRGSLAGRNPLPPDAIHA